MKQEALIPQKEQKMNEDEYKYSVCEMVHQNPLLWDPHNRDYKNLDQKSQVWEAIDKKLKPVIKGIFDISSCGPTHWHSG